MNKMQFTRLACLFGLLALAVLPLSAQGHHSFAMFDHKHAVTIKGTVSKVEWGNPHVYFFVDVTDAQGGVTKYAVECGSVNLLLRYGWKPNSVKVGDVVSADISPLRNGTSGGLLKSITLANGEVLEG